MVDYLQLVEVEEVSTTSVLILAFEEDLKVPFSNIPLSFTFAAAKTSSDLERFRL